MGGRTQPQTGQVAERGGGGARSGTVRSLPLANMLRLANIIVTSQTPRWLAQDKPT